MKPLTHPYTDLKQIILDLEKEMRNLKAASDYAMFRKGDHNSVDDRISTIENRYLTIQQLYTKLVTKITNDDSENSNKAIQVLNSMQPHQVNNILNSFIKEEVDPLVNAEDWNMDALKCHKLSYGSNFFELKLPIRLSNIINNIRESIGEQTESVRLVERIKQCNQDLKRQLQDAKEKSENSDRKMNSLSTKPG